MTSNLTLAYELAKHVNSEYLRLSGESYFNHVQKTVKLLQDIGITDEELLALAYLHHTFDLSNEFKNEITTKFGKEMCELIEKYNKLRNSEIKEIPARDLNQKLTVPTFLNLTQDIKLIVLRLADKTSNSTTTYALPADIRAKAVDRALYLYDPVCQLLGLYQFSHILQTESFKVLNPGEYLRISEFIKKTLPKLKKTLTEIEQFLIEMLAENNIKAKVEWRIKNMYSIYKKTERKNQRAESLYDIAALRILVNTVEECYKTEDLLKQLWEVLQNQRDDYIQKPKPSGYKSIHNVFYVSKNMPLEIQIKTYQMHEENEFGHASHLIYKMGDVILKQLKSDPELLKGIYYQNASNEKMWVFSKCVYVFTPKGDIIELEKGSNLIDFAYAIHAGLGHSCAGGIVNGQIQKLEYQLKDGDRVDIKTISSKKKPSEDWLKIVKTRRAKFHIRKALKLD